MLIKAIVNCNYHHNDRTNELDYHSDQTWQYLNIAVSDNNGIIR